MSRNSIDAEILYDYLVSGMSQSDIADNFDLTQPKVSQIIHSYGINKGNSQWGKGSRNQAGKFPDLSFDDICDFVDSGSRDFNSWYYDSGSDDDYEDDYVDNPRNNYSKPTYSKPTYTKPVPPPPPKPVYVPKTYDGPSRKFSRSIKDVPTNEQYYQPEPKKQVYYNDNSNNSENLGGIFLAVGILLVVCFIFWLIKGFRTSSVTIGSSFKFLYYSGYLWSSFSMGIVYAVTKFIISRDLGYIFTTTGLYAWTGLGFVVNAVRCYFATNVFMPSVLLGVIGIIIGFIGYKLFYNE